MRSLLTFCNMEGKQRPDCACACPAGMSLFFSVACFPSSTSFSQVILMVSYTSTKWVIVNKSKDSNGKLENYQEDCLLYLKNFPRREMKLACYNHRKKPHRSTLVPPKKKKPKPNHPHKPQLSLECRSSIRKTAVVLNCSKTRHWHYWTWEAGMWHSAHLAARAGQPLRAPCGPLSEAPFRSELRKTAWRYQNGFLSKDN